jgi:hypothetical protein
VYDALTAFQSFMDGITWTEIAVLFAFWPLLTLVHELGHASVALARTGGFVIVQVGRAPAALRLRIGRLVVYFDPRPGAGKVEGWAATGALLSARERIAYALAGPLASAGAAGLLTVVGRRAHAYELVVLGVLGVVSSAASLIPRHVGRFRTDGWHLREALRGNDTGQTPEQDTEARAHVYLTKQHVHVTEARRETLAAAGAEASDLGAAYAGWCWRSAEKHESAIGAEAAAALDEAARSGAVGRDLVVLAARTLADSDADFGPVFDASTARGETESQRRAFRYGGAVREIERALA